MTLRGKGERIQKLGHWRNAWYFFDHLPPIYALSLAALGHYARPLIPSR